MFTSEPPGRSGGRENRMRLKAVLFDAYGTLFDIDSGVLGAGKSIRGDLRALSTSWRQRQLEYTWLRSVMGHYEDFWSLTQTALVSTLWELHIEASEAQRNILLQAYLCPFIFPDVKSALERLALVPRVILSNGSPKMLKSADQQNALEGIFADVISVERVRTYTPSRRVYALGTESLGFRADEILFASSNWWDAWG